jgi:hypothetical protein
VGGLSDAGNNVTATGPVSVAVSSTGAPLFIWGTRSSSLMWPASVLPTEYTFFHVTRYLSGNKGGSRIYQSAGSENSISGFYNGMVGGRIVVVGSELDLMQKRMDPITAGTSYFLLIAEILSGSMVEKPAQMCVDPTYPSVAWL